MSKRNRREHGRILSVETMARGDSLADDFAAGVTSITVNDAGDFDEDGGWLYVGAQTVEYTECDDDTGIITLADPLAAAAEQGDPVRLWSDLYGEVVEYQQALVELDGEYDNPDPVVAEVAEGVGELPEGDRGKAGESCVLHRVAEDEWEVVGVGGRSRKSQSIRFEQDDAYALTPADITAGSAVLSLSHRPIDEALTCVLAGVPQRPTAWTIDYNAQTLTVPLSGWEQAGDELWVHYAYRKGISTAAIVGTVTVEMPLVGVAGSTLDVSNLTGSIVGVGQVWSDGDSATYVEYSTGNARSPYAAPSTPIPGTGYTVEMLLKTTFAADTSGFGVSVWQAGFGTILNLVATPAPYLDADGWLHCLLSPDGFATSTTAAQYLNDQSAVAIIGSFAAGQVHEGKIVVSWDTV